MHIRLLVQTKIWICGNGRDCGIRFGAKRVDNVYQITLPSKSHNLWDVKVSPSIVRCQARSVQNIAENPLQNPYTALKACLIERFSVADRKRLNRMINKVQLGDQRPSQLFLDLKSLANNCLQRISGRLNGSLCYRRKHKLFSKSLSMKT